MPGSLKGSGSQGSGFQGRLRWGGGDSGYQVQVLSSDPSCPGEEGTQDIIFTMAQAPALCSSQMELGGTQRVLKGTALMAGPSGNP